MLDSNFINGFADELTLEKRAAHPLISVVSHKGGSLGRKIKGMVSRKTKLGKKKRFRMRKRAEAAAPPDVKPPAQKDTPQLPQPQQAAAPAAQPTVPMPGQDQQSAPVPSSGPPIGRSKMAAAQVIKKVLDEARPGTQPRPKGLGAQVLDEGAADTEYGGGLGNFEGRQAKPYTDTDNPVDNKKAGLGKQVPAFKKKGGYMPSARFRAGANNLSDTEMRVMEAASNSPYRRAMSKRAPKANTKTASKARSARKAGGALKKLMLGGGAVVGGAAAYENRDKLKKKFNQAKGNLGREVEMRRREHQRRQRKDRALNRVGL